MPTITGLSAFPITPSLPDGRIDTDALQTLLARLVAAGVDGIGLLGSTGSYPYFSRAERRRAVAAAVECVGGRVKLLVGIGALSTAEAIALATDARDAGADFGLLAPVSYAPLNEAEVFGLFRDVAGSGLPLCIYNNPRNTQFDFTAELIARLAALPGIVAIKNPAPEPGLCATTVDALRAVLPADVSLGFSVDWHAPHALRAGGDAWYSVLGGLYPRLCLRLTRAAQRNDSGEFTRLNTQLQPLWSLFRSWSSYRVMHACAARLGIANAVPPRPVLPLSDAAAAEIENVMQQLDRLEAA